VRATGWREVKGEWATVVSAIALQAMFVHVYTTVVVGPAECLSQSIKQDICTPAFKTASNMEDTGQKVFNWIVEFITKYLREEEGPALLDWSQSKVDSLVESGSQVGMVRRQGHGTCVVRGRLIREADVHNSSGGRGGAG
jgi:hypothetical protein